MPQISIFKNVSFFVTWNPMLVGTVYNYHENDVTKNDKNFFLENLRYFMNHIKTDFLSPKLFKKQVSTWQKRAILGQFSVSEL